MILADGTGTIAALTRQTIVLPPSGTLYNIRITEHDGNFCRVGAIAAVVEIPDTPLIKNISGVIRIPSGGAFGFVADCFIPPVLIQQGNFANGQRVAGHAKLDYDRRKEKWSYIINLLVLVLD